MQKLIKNSNSSAKWLSDTESFEIFVDLFKTSDFNNYFGQIIDFFSSKKFPIKLFSFNICQIILISLFASSQLFAMDRPFSFKYLRLLRVCAGQFCPTYMAPHPQQKIYCSNFYRYPNPELRMGLI